MAGEHGPASACNSTIKTAAGSNQHNLNGLSRAGHPTGGNCLVREQIQARIDAMQVPDERSDVEQIWEIVRSWLVISRVVALVLMIILSEFTEEYLLMGISVSAWCIVIGIPVMIAISVFIILGDRSQKSAQEVEPSNVLKRPIMERR
ncbi:MAG TPA: hypothetical protein EYO09_04650 [Candidatus Poseidoniales archaeon]|nr:hypothetical protein [Candidatus Poseidoniales archaeon]